MNRWTGLRAFFSGLVDTAWLRHANPWSVYTRFAAIPAGIVAIWSRAWIGEWSALPIAVVVLWLILNPIAFSPVHTPTHWISKGIYGERLWLRGAVKTRRRRYMLNGLAVAGALGLLIVAWGLAIFSVVACCLGALLTVVATKTSATTRIRGQPEVLLQRGDRRRSTRAVVDHKLRVEGVGRHLSHHQDM
jgi:hypothetical protein